VLVEKLIPLVVSILWRESEPKPPEPSSDIEGLSEREWEISRLLVMGYSGVNVAAITGLRENTIKTYIRRIYQKLGISNRADLVRALYAGVKRTSGPQAPETGKEAWELGGRVAQDLYSPRASK
jgi:DNA-binding CsgD family transcriptional regulator